MVSCDDIAEITKHCDEWVQARLIREMEEWHEQGGALSIVSRESKDRYYFYVKIQVGYHVYSFYKKMKKGKLAYTHSFISNDDIEAINEGFK